MSTRIPFFHSAFAIILLFSLSGCTKSEKPNIVLLVIDTLRADYLPVYGSKNTEAPFITKLANEGVVFENSFSTSSWTAPGTASILTGLYPLQHGVLMGRRSTKKLVGRDSEMKLNKLPQSVETIGEVMKRAGYATFGAADNGNIREDGGFAQGFDHFVTFQNKGGENLNKQIKSWASKIKKSKNYFLYMQYMDPHHPYVEHKPWFKGENERGIKRASSAYRSEISFTDTKIEELYKEFGWDENTILIVTADHGEEFGEHGSAGHGKTLYSEVVRTPLIIHYPGSKVKPARVAEYVSGVDIVPTIASFVGVDVADSVQGISLKPLLEKTRAEENRDVYNHLWKKQKAGWILEIKSLAEGDHRLIESSRKGKQYLYNLRTDIHEKRNIAGKNPNIVTSLKKRREDLESGFHVYEREWMPIPLDEEDFEE